MRHGASGLYSYLVAQFVGSAVQPQSGVSQSGPARNASETTKSDPGSPSHCYPLQGWSDTTQNSKIKVFRVTFLLFSVLFVTDNVQQ